MDWEIAYELVGDRECNCGAEFSKRYIEFSETPDRREFLPESHDEVVTIEESTGVSYTCPECNLEWSGLLDELEYRYRLRLKNSAGGFSSQLIDKEKIAIQVSEGERIIDLLLELGVSSEILGYHLSAIEDMEFEQNHSPFLQTDILPILAHLKAYFAEAYSFQKTFDTITTEGIPEQERAEKLFDDYKRESRVVRGLRIYTQKERNIIPDLRWKPGGSTSLYLDLDSVQTMDSEAEKHGSDGYRDGSEKYYGHLADSEIDLLELVTDHYSQVQWFNEQLIQATLGKDSEARDDIEEWSELQEQYAERFRRVHDSNQTDSTIEEE